MITYEEEQQYGEPTDYPIGSYVGGIVTGVKDYANPRVFYRIEYMVNTLNGNPVTGKKMSITVGNNAHPTNNLGKLITQVYGKSALEKKTLDRVEHFIGKNIVLKIIGWTVKADKNGQSVSYPVYDVPPMPAVGAGAMDTRTKITPDDSMDTVIGKIKTGNVEIPSHVPFPGVPRVTVDDPPKCDFCDRPLTTGVQISWTDGNGENYTFCGTKCKVKFQQTA